MLPREPAECARSCWAGPSGSSEAFPVLSRLRAAARRPARCLPALVGAAPTRLRCRWQFVADGVFFAELNEMLTRELAEDGYSGAEVRVTPLKTEIIIRATRTQSVLGAHPRCS